MNKTVSQVFEKINKMTTPTWTNKREKDRETKRYKEDPMEQNEEPRNKLIPQLMSPNI